MSDGSNLSPGIANYSNNLGKKKKEKGWGVGPVTEQHWSDESSFQQKYQSGIINSIKY